MHPIRTVPRLARWIAAAMWITHGVWVLINQFHGFLLGEVFMAVGELLAGVMITRGKVGYDILATIISLFGGLLSALFLTKTPVVAGVASTMALVAVFATVLTIGVSAWDGYFDRQTNKQGEAQDNR